MPTPRPQYFQPKEKSAFGAQIHKVCEHLSIGLPSFQGTFIATAPEESLWRVNVTISGRTVDPETDSIDFSLEVETWDLGKAMNPCFAWAYPGGVPPRTQRHPLL